MAAGRRRFPASAQGRNAMKTGFTIVVLGTSSGA